MTLRKVFMAQVLFSRGHSTRNTSPDDNTDKTKYHRISLLKNFHRNALQTEGVIAVQHCVFGMKRAT